MPSIPHRVSVPTMLTASEPSQPSRPAKKAATSPAARPRNNRAPSAASPGFWQLLELLVVVLVAVLVLAAEGVLAAASRGGCTSLFQPQARILELQLSNIQFQKPGKSCYGAKDSAKTKDSTNVCLDDGGNHQAWTSSDDVGTRGGGTWDPRNKLGHSVLESEPFKLGETRGPLWGGDPYPKHSCWKLLEVHSEKGGDQITLIFGSLYFDNSRCKDVRSFEINTDTSGKLVHPDSDMPGGGSDVTECTYEDGFSGNLENGDFTVISKTNDNIREALFMQSSANVLAREDAWKSAYSYGSTTWSSGRDAHDVNLKAHYSTKDTCFKDSNVGDQFGVEYTFKKMHCKTDITSTSTTTPTTTTSSLTSTTTATSTSTTATSTTTTASTTTTSGTSTSTTTVSSTTTTTATTSTTSITSTTTTDSTTTTTASTTTTTASSTTTTTATNTSTTTTPTLTAGDNAASPDTNGTLLTGANDAGTFLESPGAIAMFVAVGVCLLLAAIFFLARHAHQPQATPSNAYGNSGHGSAALNPGVRHGSEFGSSSSSSSSSSTASTSAALIGNGGTADAAAIEESFYWHQTSGPRKSMTGTRIRASVASYEDLAASLEAEFPYAAAAYVEQQHDGQRRASAADDTYVEMCTPRKQSAASNGPRKSLTPSTDGYLAEDVRAAWALGFAGSDPQHNQQGGRRQSQRHMYRQPSQNEHFYPSTPAAMQTSSPTSLYASGVVGTSATYEYM